MFFLSSFLARREAKVMRKVVGIDRIGRTIDAHLSGAFPPDRSIRNIHSTHVGFYRFTTDLAEDFHGDFHARGDFVAQPEDVHKVRQV